MSGERLGTSILLILYTSLHVITFAVISKLDLATESELPSLYLSHPKKKNLKDDYNNGSPNREKISSPKCFKKDIDIISLITQSSLCRFTFIDQFCEQTFK